MEDQCSINFKVTRWDRIRWPTWWIFRGSKADPALVAMWAKRRFSRLGTTTGFRNKETKKQKQKKKERKRKEEVKSDFGRMRRALGFLQILVLQILGVNVETWKRGNRAAMLTFHCALEASDLRGIHLHSNRTRNIEKIQRCFELLQAWNTFTN